MAGYYGITLAVRASVRLSYVRPYFRFRTITWVKSMDFPNSVYVLILWRPDLGLLIDFHQTVCALILRRPGLGLLMGKFRQFLTELSVRDTSVFSFLDDSFINTNAFSPNLVCALILWRSTFGLLMGEFRPFLTDICPQYIRILLSGQ